MFRDIVHLINRQVYVFSFIKAWAVQFYKMHDLSAYTWSEVRRKIKHHALFPTCIEAAEVVLNTW